MAKDGWMTRGIRHAIMFAMCIPESKDEIRADATISAIMKSRSTKDGFLKPAMVNREFSRLGMSYNRRHEHFKRMHNFIIRHIPDFWKV
jgi:hypothetical protein